MAEPVLGSGARPAAPEFDDIQAIVRFGHGHLTAAAFWLLRIADPAAAREWLGGAPVTSAISRNPLPDTALQLAFTAEGLRALGLPEAAMAKFSDEFNAGLAGDESRSRRLGDIGDNAPSRWRWGAPGNVPHLLVMLYATPERLDGWQREVMGPLWDRAFAPIELLDTAALDGYEPFGFADGLSQPAIDWNRAIVPGELELEYRNVAALGEFLLGYPNEYGRYTDRPLLDPSERAATVLLPAEDDPAKRDLGRNGTYLVLRDLRQDVRGFWEFLERHAAAFGVSAQELAESMVGRSMRGRPLAHGGNRPIAGVPADDTLNQFTFASDADGAVCPLGAHIRRANPRNADMPGGPGGPISRLVRTLGFARGEVRGDLVAPARFHRVLRRGRKYGDDGAPDGERGLRFVCLNANIARQFEFVQNAWLMSAHFGGLSGESDPLLGNRQLLPGCPATSAFTRPRPDGVPTRLTALPQFVTVRGGAYFFLPGLRALRYLAGSRMDGR
ncbi:MAG: Dyp-type peroxidase [Alphaproteobacteria bacterium]